MRRSKNIKFDQVSESAKQQHQAKMFLHPMKDWHLYSKWENGVQAGGPIQYVWLFGIVGIFVLLLACINFMNLSTARSEQRAREVGIRKSMGSVRKQLIYQFLSESMVVAVFSFVIALFLVNVSIPWFNELADKKMVFLLSNVYFWVVGIVFLVVTGFMAGSYPALYLSSFQPVKVLKGTFRVGRLASIPRKALVVLQFSVSVILIIGTIVVYRQVQFTKSRPIGYDRDGVVMIQMKSPDYKGKYDLLRYDLKNAGAIEEMSQSSSPLTGVWSSDGEFDWEGRNPDLNPEFGTIFVTHDFGSTISWQVKEGRDFSREIASDASAVIINEAAAVFMNVKNPVGTIIKWGDESFKIIGVVKDLVMESPFKAVRQTLYFNNYERMNWIELKLNPAITSTILS